MVKGVIEKNRYCYKCNKQVMHYRKVNHMSLAIQIILFVITGGFWAMVWILSLIDDKFKVPFTQPWHCSACHPQNEQIKD